MSGPLSPLTVMLAGLESAGKTALFRGLTGRMTGDEANVRGSTVVWLAATFTSCLVTLWTIRRELGWGTAARLAGRQAVTSFLFGWLISLMTT